MNLDKAAKAIKERGDIITPDSLVVQSLFSFGGTITEQQASDYLWAKRVELETKSRRKYPNAETWVWSIPFLYWTGEKR